MLGTNKGVVLFDVETETFRSFFEQEDINKKIGQKIYALLLDRNQRLWIGSENKGLSLYDFKSGNFKELQK